MVSQSIIINLIPVSRIHLHDIFNMSWCFSVFSILLRKNEIGLSVSKVREASIKINMLEYRREFKGKCPRSCEEPKPQAQFPAAVREYEPTLLLSPRPPAFPPPPPLLGQISAFEDSAKRNF